MWIDFVQSLHASTTRDYVQRVVEFDKAKCATVAKKFGADYWDGPRQYGYGGYSYDGRWRPLADKLAAHYGLKPGMRVLDVGCGKGYLLFEMTQSVPGIEVAGVDISAYAIENAKEEVRPFLQVGTASDLAFENDRFDLVVSLGTLHNLKINDLYDAIRHIERVQKMAAYVMVESYRDEREKANLLYWQLTCESFYSPDEWQWIYEQAGYSGDFGFIYFE